MDVNKLIAIARSWLGTPFHHQGRQPGRGLDCIGLLTQLNKSVGYDPYDRTNYGRLGGRGELEQGLGRLYRRTDFNIQPGRILHFRNARTKREHCALVTDRGMLHCHYRRGVVEHKISDYWRAQIVGVYQWLDSP